MLLWLTPYICILGPLGVRTHRFSQAPVMGVQSPPEKGGWCCTEGALLCREPTKSLGEDL